MATAQRDGDGDLDPVAELRAYVLENPGASVTSLREIFHLSYRRVVACLADLEASGALVRESVVCTDGRSYPARIAQGRDLSVVRDGLAAKRPAVEARVADLAVEELSLVLPAGAVARAEKRTVPDKADGVVTGRMVVSARWLLGLVDASAGRDGGGVRRRVLKLPVEARADERRVELVVLRGALIDTRVAVDAAWLASLVGRSHREDDGFDVAELVDGLPDVARAKVVVQDLAAVATGVPARVEVDARWLARLAVRRGSRATSRAR